jgi:hypothetical protein
MRTPKIMAVVVTEAPLVEVRFAAAAHDFNFVVELAPEQLPARTARARRYEVALADGAAPRPELARTLREQLLSLWPGTIVYEAA